MINRSRKICSSTDFAGNSDITVEVTIPPGWDKLLCVRNSVSWCLLHTGLAVGGNFRSCKNHDSSPSISVVNVATLPVLGDIRARALRIVGVIQVQPWVWKTLVPGGAPGEGCY